MFPPFKFGGKLIPFEKHKIKPFRKEIDGAIRVLTALTVLTAFVAISMVLFGQVKDLDKGMAGSLYHLTLSVGVVLLLLCVGILYFFRKDQRPESLIKDVLPEVKYYFGKKAWRIWLDLFLSGVAILITAESMIKAMEVFSLLTYTPFVITGIMIGFIGCLGEIIVVHNFSVHPNGRIGDAIVGVAMDNIITVLGASIVAIMGGIFLGGNSLILIFIIILTVNTLLIEQISRLKNDAQVFEVNHNVKRSAKSAILVSKK